MGFALRVVAQTIAKTASSQESLALARDPLRMSDLPSPAPATMSGKRITVVVLITLLLTGFLFYWVATSYASYNAARRQTDRSWRELAVLLGERYRQYDAQVDQALAEKELDAEQAERWRSARDSFSRTTLISHQAEAAQTLEAVIAQLPASFRLPEQDSPRVRELSSLYSSAAERQMEVGGSSGSQMLKLMLHLPDPPHFSLAGNPVEPL